MPCATFRSPHTLLVCSIFCHRVLADYGPPIAAAGLHRHTLPCATFRSLHTVLVLADYGPPIAAARPLICHGPLYTASSCCCQVQSLSWVPVRPPIAAVSIATLCHVPLSGLL
ncbi:unnamed protein product, partial [Staurois parvus]